MYIRYFKMLILALLATLLLAGCSSRESDVDKDYQTEDILSRFNADGKAWMSLEIPFANKTMTRGNNGTFDDGTDDEYKVKDAYILVFAGASESTAKFASAYQVTSLTPVTSEDEQITIKATISIDDANINTGDKLYVFVLLNNNSSAITTSTFPATSIAFADGTELTGGTSTYSAIANTTIGSYKDTNNYFLMTNARLADKNTIAANLFTLVEVPASLFYPTEDEALDNPAVHIHVERLAVKSSVVDGLEHDYVLGNSNITFKTADLKWALDNYNISSYLYRHLGAINYSRMVESNAVEAYSSKYPQVYRTYWCEDINYNSKNGLNYVSHADYMNYTNDQKTAFWHALSSSDYCAENTFDISHMQDDCTTSVLVRLSLNGGEDFYTTSVTGSDVIYQAPSTTISEEGTSAEQSFAPRRSSKVSSAKPIDEYLREWLMQTHSQLRQWVHDYAGGEARHLKIAVAGDKTTGLATATVTQTARTTGDGVTDFAKLGLDTYLANNIVIRYYYVGLCYYRVPIKHFGDELTPWASAPAMTGYTPTAAYGDSDASYLGRYGVVRNNWYQINIRRVTHVGSPIVPPLTQEADDQVEQLLNATLTINNWTSHNQDL